MVKEIVSQKALAGQLHRVGPVDTVPEIGPHSTLKGPVRETLGGTTAGKTIDYVSLLGRFKSALETLPPAVGSLHPLGHFVDIVKFNDAGYPSKEPHQLLVNLPAYPFDHSHSYWPRTGLDNGYRFRHTGRHDSLGTPTPEWNPMDAK